MKMTVGILAHVDAGKTTFSERVLYTAGAIRSLGRVDHQNAFLDSHPIERERGITIFSGQACFQLGGHTVYWLDTPGHADFTAQMERSVSVMDAAILLVSAAEGVQSHAETVWHIMEAYHKPVFVFINKTDREGADVEAVMTQLRERLSSDMLDLRNLQQTGVLDEATAEEIAAGDDMLMDTYFTSGVDQELWMDSLSKMIAQRTFFPVCAGSALLGNGVEEFLQLFLRLIPGVVSAQQAALSDTLSARVYRIRHDQNKARLCFLKILSGSLRVKDTLQWQDESYKVNELRIYHGEKYHSTDIAEVGDLVAIPGLQNLHPGCLIGPGEALPQRTEPMLASQILWDTTSIPVFKMSEAIHTLQDEEPTLSVEQIGDRINVHVMGAIQLQILQQLMKDRFGYDISFGPQTVLYRETVAEPVIGIGHYEPLRHYAQVHVRLVPGEAGSGIHFRSLAHVDDLALNWQRLIETHVFEKQHRGVLTGSPLTDVTIELLCGRAHLKHTEGGDFRQATYRAIRNALMYANSILLQPICAFVMRVPDDQYPTIAGSLSRMKIALDIEQLNGHLTQIKGEAPFALFSQWQQDFMMLTHGRGSLRVWLARYAPCHNADEVIAAVDYHPLADDTPDSVFCSHGAGFTVAWDHVHDFAHLSHEGL